MSASKTLTEPTTRLAQVAAWFAPPVVEEIAPRHEVRIVGAWTPVEILVSGWGWIGVGGPAARANGFRRRFVSWRRYELLARADEPLVIACWNVVGVRRQDVRIAGHLAVPRADLPRTVTDLAPDRVELDPPLAEIAAPRARLAEPTVRLWRPASPLAREPARLAADRASLPRQRPVPGVPTPPISQPSVEEP